MEIKIKFQVTERYTTKFNPPLSQTTPQTRVQISLYLRYPKRIHYIISHSIFLDGHNLDKWKILNAKVQLRTWLSHKMSLITCQMQFEIFEMDHRGKTNYYTRYERIG